MFRLIFTSVLVMGVAAAQAQQGTPPKGSVDQTKLAKCRQLAKDRGFTSGIENAKGANGPRQFVIACMQGKQG